LRMDGGVATGGSLGAGWFVVVGSFIAAAVGLYLGVSLLSHVAVEDFYVGPSRFTESYANLSKGLTYSSALAAVLAVVALIAALRHQANAALVISGAGIGLILLASLLSWLVTPSVGAEKRVDLGGGELLVPWDFNPRVSKPGDRAVLDFRYPAGQSRPSHGECAGKSVVMSLQFVGADSRLQTGDQTGGGRFLRVGPYAVYWVPSAVRACLGLNEAELARTVASWQR